MVLDHGPSNPAAPEDVAAQARNSRIGLVLFFIYATIYAAFVIIAAFRPEVMKSTPLWGVNLAILWGFGLIFGAFILSILYGWLCRSISSAPIGKGDVR